MPKIDDIKAGKIRGLLVVDEIVYPTVNFRWLIKSGLKNRILQQFFRTTYKLNIKIHIGGGEYSNKLHEIEWRDVPIVTEGVLNE